MTGFIRQMCPRCGVKGEHSVLVRCQCGTMMESLADLLPPDLNDANLPIKARRRNIFVFGSNLAGRHGKGAALAAMYTYGAKYGFGHGLTGEAYAIPTKDENLKTLPLNAIYAYVQIFLRFAKDHPEMDFKVTRIGCGLAGYNDEDIAPMFRSAPKNCQLPKEWI